MPNSSSYFLPLFMIVFMFLIYVIFNNVNFTVFLQKFTEV